MYQLAQQLRLERPYIAGHDIGAMVAYAFARLYPTQVLTDSLANRDMRRRIQHDLSGIGQHS